MPLTIPNLDDRTWNELVTELRRNIPTLTDRWTDYNFSDPGITVLEMFAFLGEMAIYRLNRITERARHNYLKLLVEPATPVTVGVTFALSTSPDFLSPPLAEVTIPVGTIVAADVEGREYLFETIAEGIIPAELTSPLSEFSAVIQARSLSRVTDETLGVSDGKPNQIFPLTKTPVLLDALNISETGYNPNPKLLVGGETDWQYRPDLLDSTDADKHFTVDSMTGNVRFGDGIRGQIPPADALMVCENYQTVLGSEARVLAGEISQVRSEIPGVSQSEMTAFNESDARGGTNVFPISEGFSSGLSLHKEVNRAITPADYEYLVKEMFNREYAFRPGQRQVARVKCLPRLSHNIVDLMIVPQPNLISSPPQEEAYPEADEDLENRVRNFLEPRQLITVEVFIRGPVYQDR